MAPHPMIIEGVEGKHSSPPVKSAVMLLFVPDADELSIAFIKRTDKGRYHAGQIAFPGGRTEPEDKNELETALRECREEVGVLPEDIFVLGRLSDIYIPLSNFQITPIVGAVLKKPDFCLCEDEVEKVLLVKLSELFKPENKTKSSFYRHNHEIIAPGYQIGEHFIWGATAMIISELEHIFNRPLRD